MRGDHYTGTVTPSYAMYCIPKRLINNGSLSGLEDKSPWKEFSIDEDGLYPGRK